MEELASMSFTRPAHSTRVHLASLDTHVLDWEGVDPPILLLHPNRTNARVWDFVVEYSGLKNRFLAPDARGHGRSGYPRQGYGYADYLGDRRALAALIDAFIGNQ